MKNKFIYSRVGLILLLAAVIVVFRSMPVRAVTYGTHSKAYTPSVYTPAVYTSSVQPSAPTVYMRSTSSMRMMTPGTVPSLASTVPSASQPYRSKGNPRKAKPSYDGEEDGESKVDDEDPSIIWYWNEDLEDWVSSMPVGTVKEGDDGYYYEGDGTTWVRKGQIADLGTPIGDAPWWLMVWLLLAYGVVKKVGFRRNNG